MPSLSEYFSKNRYQGKWIIGDRVSGKYSGIPFIGTVMNDSVVNEIEGPKVSVHLDLPLKHKNKFHTIIFCKPKDLKKLQKYD